SRSEPLIARWLDEYAEATPGTDVLANVTNILGPDSQPQPDICLIVDSDCGGQTTIDKDDFLVGPVELAVEISYSSESIDLNAKLLDYEKAGVGEYLVVALRRNEVFWFARKRNKFQPLPVGKDGILHSGMFPGLWLDPAALLERERQQLLTVLRAGLESPAHQAFVGKLAKKKA
ncbi:MAG TPA: Uma2 family endonuclease, partial [Pirellulaceae bacterium]|nr:Uma2 family endonuclease [Pirellulaceae bacterium]